MRFLKVFWLVLIVSVLVLISSVRHFRETEERPTKLLFCDTVTYIDTIRYYVPVPRDSVVIRYVTERLPLKSTSSDEPEPDNPVTIPDSADVDVPITQKVYEDSTYKAYVSGYKPNLDSLFVYGRERVVTVTKPQKKRRWALGVQAGIGVGRHGVSPYVGVGGTYALWSF